MAVPPSREKEKGLSELSRVAGDLAGAAAPARPNVDPPTCFVVKVNMVRYGLRPAVQIGRRLCQSLAHVAGFCIDRHKGRQVRVQEGLKEEETSPFLAIGYLEV
jgi:hypothetical protein